MTCLCVKYTDFVNETETLSSNVPTIRLPGKTLMFVQNTNFQVSGGVRWGQSNVGGDSQMWETAKKVFISLNARVSRRQL